MVFFFAVLAILAQSTDQPLGSDYAIKREVLSNGGGVSRGATFQLIGSFSQTDASQTMTGQSYTLTGGYWQGNDDLIFINEFE